MNADRLKSEQPLRRLERVATRDARVPYSADDPTMGNGWRNIPIPPTADGRWFIHPRLVQRQSNCLGPLARCDGQRMTIIIRAREKFIRRQTERALEIAEHYRALNDPDSAAVFDDCSGRAEFELEQMARRKPQEGLS
jgi:hypothetical protein